MWARDLAPFTFRQYGLIQLDRLVSLISITVASFIFNAYNYVYVGFYSWMWIILILQPLPDPVSPQNDLSNDNHSSSGSLYKFKNNIRERFEHSKPVKSPSSAMIYNGKTPNNSTEPLHLPLVHDHYPSVSRPVPIFALHANGSFYVPLTVDSHLLSPFVTDINGDYNLHGFSPLLLHPVTISVNFNRPSIQSAPLLPSVSFSSKLQNGPLMMVPECRWLKNSTSTIYCFIAVTSREWVFGLKTAFHFIQ